MAQIILTVPDDSLDLFVTSFSEHFGYQATLPDGTDNKQTAEEFTQAYLIRYCKSVIGERLANKARDDAMATAAKTVTDLDLVVDVPPVKKPGP